MREVKMYFKGDSGIKNPIDLQGNAILEGDILTRDYGDYESIGLKVGENYATEPFYKVKINETGGFYAESINPVGGIILDGDKNISIYTISGLNSA